MIKTRHVTGRSLNKCPQRKGSSRNTFVEKLFDKYYDLFRTEARGHGHSNPNMVYDTLPPQDTHIHQILDSEVKVMITMTLTWYAALHHPMMHPHTKFGIPTSSNIGDVLWTRYSRNDVRTQNGKCQTLHNPKMHPHHHTFYLEFLPQIL